MTRVVVVGGDAAGMSAAARAHRLDPSLDIVAFERSAHTSYAAAGMPYFVAGLVPDADTLVVRSPEQHRANGLDVRTRHEVVGIDTDAHTVEVVDLDRGTTTHEDFDHLVVATGAAPIRPRIDGIDAPGIFRIDDLDEAIALDVALTGGSPRQAVVVGGGYTGLEMVEVLMLRGCTVTLIEAADQPMPKLDEDMGDRIATALRAEGVDLRLGTRVTGFATGTDGHVIAVVTDRGEIATDLVVTCLGVRPNTAFAAEAGITTGPAGAILTDARRATNVDGIWAVGDCSASHHRVSQRPVWVGLGTHANKHGRVAGTNIAGGSARFDGVIGTAITKFGDVEIACTGLNEADAVEAGFDVRTTTVEGDTRADYFPGAAKMTLKIIVDHPTGRLLGAQIVGGPESGKRIDALAVAVWNAMNVEAFTQLDLAYSPPYAPVWETALIAARLASG